jgi:pimeloyl-ACP methyl ester carboxylesterase
MNTRNGKMGLDYGKLVLDGFGTIELEQKNFIDYPGNEVVEWYGFRRHNFELEGCKGFIVEPINPAPGLPWCWCTQWAEAFVPRTPALKLLERGFHHVHLDVFSTRMNPEGIKKVEAFYAMLRSLKFHPKAALIGMSYGGLFSLRWAQEHPETVGVIYLDAPVTDLAFANRSGDKGITKDSLVNAAAYGVAPEELRSHPLSPNNNFQAIADAKIPILCLRSGQDLTVLPQENTDVFASRLTAAGGKIRVVNRSLNGHHPHGLDDPAPLAEFILRYYPELEY